MLEISALPPETGKGQFLISVLYTHPSSLHPSIHPLIHLTLNTLSLFSPMKGQYASGQLNGYQLWSNAVVLTPKNGWVAIGTRSFESNQFDNIAIVAKG